MAWITESAMRACKPLTSGKLIGTPAALMSSPAEFLDAARDPDTVCFLDHETLESVSKLDQALLPKHVVAICSDPVPTAISWLNSYPWLHHVISASTLELPMAEELLQNLVGTLKASEPRLLDWLDSEVDGRRIRLSHASKRAARIEKMNEFLESKGVGLRTIQMMCDGAEELLTNAFYDAPVAAGASKPISRTMDVELPEKYACDLAYGCRRDLAVVRVRDPFGSLSRRRLVEVLVRCSQPNGVVRPDESMGGAGLGMWRIFTNASFVAISVVKQRHTEILVGYAKKAAGQRPYAFHLFFTETPQKRSWKLGEETSFPDVNHSVLLQLKDGK